MKKVEAFLINTPKGIVEIGRTNQHEELTLVVEDNGSLIIYARVIPPEDTGLAPSNRWVVRQFSAHGWSDIEPQYE